VTAENWHDFAALFAARGAPHYCFCTIYRTPKPLGTSAQKRGLMQRLVERDTPIGVLAYEGDQVVGWCSVAPRESYVKLERSRTMPRVSEAPTWVVLCFFVTRAARGRGLTRALLEGAVAYARAHGAKLIEGYPHDTAGTSATHRGHSGVFAESGFERDGPRWFRQLRPQKTKP
jgi:GNAT superfamily N-acetyltransferase